MWFLYFLIYWFIGLFFAYKLASSYKSNGIDSSAWVVIYGIGSLFWPIIICMYLFNKKFN